MRIGFDARYIDDRYHGIGRFAWQLLEALSRNCPADRFVAYVNPNRPSTRLDLSPVLGQSNVELRHLRWDIYHPAEQVAFGLAAARDRLDLMYSPYFAAPLLVHCPVVTTVHDLIFDRVPDYQSGKWVRFYYRPMMRLSSRKSKTIVAVSDATAADLRRVYDVPAEKITVVPEAADPRFHPIVDPIELLRVEQKYSLPSEFVLALGAHRPHKNLAVLVEAFGRARAQFPHSLILAGEVHTRYDDPTPALIDRLGLQNRVLPIGHVSETDLPALYSLADAFVQPSLIEGFGLPVLEAMSCGTPVIASNTSSLPEVVGNAGVLADPTNPDALAAALVDVLTSSRTRGHLRSLGLARAAEFSWDRTASMVREIFESAFRHP